MVMVEVKAKEQEKVLALRKVERKGSVRFITAWQ
jgi:hypothetical protein